MATDDGQIEDLAEAHGLRPAALRDLLDELRAATGVSHYYVFWTAGGGAGAPGAGRSRTLVAFPSPDAALAFAQRHRLARPPEAPRLRRLGLTQLLTAMLRAPAIGALLLADETDDAPDAGLPPGLRLDRDELLRRLM